MALMRMLAFMPAASGAVKASNTEGNAAQPPAGVSAPESKKKPVDHDWNALIKRLPLAGMERMLAHNCELVTWQDGRIQLRLPHAQRHLNDRAYQDRLKQALEQHLDTKIRLEISLGAGNGNTPAEIHNRDSEQRLGVAAAAIDGDPFVRDLIENFDARVVPSTIKPVQ
jgi:DNA polymerase-3 subunit gamma/tau